MRPAFIAAVLAVAPGATIADARPLRAKPAPVLRLERVVMLMRHGIRPPTKAVPGSRRNSTAPGPRGPVDPGRLTPRGAAGVALLGAADRRYYQARGLFGAGCPAAGSIVLHASGKQRAIRTAESWRDGFMPGCAAVVEHPADDGPDPIFHGLDDKPAGVAGERAFREAAAIAPISPCWPTC